MLIILRAKNMTSNMRSDIGQYDIVNKKMQIWVNSSRLVNAETMLTIPEFDVPKDVKKVELRDAGTDQVLQVPLDVFNSSLQKDGTHKFEWSEWFKKYRRL